MQSVTLSIAIAASILVLFLRPAKAFAIYIMVLLWYPTYLVFLIGPLHISAVRVIVTILLLRCLLDSEIKKNFKWSHLDSWVTFAAVISVAVPLVSSVLPAAITLQNRTGRLTDTYFAYLAARYCLSDRRAIVIATKWIALAAVPLALLGVVESYSGWQSFNFLKVYCPWQPITEPELNLRSGFYRAVGPFNHSIAFGVSLSTILPLIYCLRYEKGLWRKGAYMLMAAMAIGVLSSMSSGPLTMLLIVILCLALEWFKYLVKPLLYVVAFLCVLIQIVSNRPFYRVLLSYINPLGGAGWHRAKIIDLAIEHFGEWWLVGYGGSDPGWGESLGMDWSDVTNHYVVAGIEDGLLGIIAVCGMLATGLYMAICLYRSTQDTVLRSWYWALGSVIVTLAIIFNGVLFSGQAGTIFYCILGFTGSSYNIAMRNQFSKEHL